VFNLALPASDFLQRRLHCAPRRRIPVLSKIMGRLPDGLAGAPAVEALATGRPVKDPAFQIMDDHIGEVENVGERGVRGSPPISAIGATRLSRAAIKT
jgi:hypothetical protein